MNIRETFKKQGGMNLIAQYFRNGSLMTGICEFFLLGKSRVALEILRLSTEYKTRKKIERKFKREINRIEKENELELPHKESNIIWICWLQGIENAPKIVKKCFCSLKENIKDKRIIVITSDNIKQFVQFPDYIIEKWRKGIITNTHFTDLLRLELLIQYGGLWLDATVFCSGGEIPAYYFNSDLFLFQSLKPGRDGNSMYISSWLIGAKTNNRILMETRDLCYEYWKKKKNMDSYYLFHIFISIVLEKNEKEWKKIVPCDNETPHILWHRLFDEYDDTIWNAVKSKTIFHKLSYKYDEQLEGYQNTFYKKIIEGKTYEENII